MPDPGMTDLPPVAPGQDTYNKIAASDGQATANAWKLQKAAALLKSNQFTPNDVNAYFGDKPATPSPAAHDAAVGNVSRAVATNDGDNSFLADPARATLTAIGLDPKGVDWYLQSVRTEQQRDDQGYRTAQGSFAAAHDKLENNDLTGGVDLVKGIMDFSGAGFQHAVSAVTGPLYEGVAKPLYKAAPITGEVVSGVSQANQAAAVSMFGPVGKYVAPVADPTDPHALSDAVGGVMLMAGGGDHFGETAKVPEGARALAVDGMRDGSLRDPIDLAKTSGHDTPPPELTKAMPLASDFTAAVEQLGGAKVWTDPIAKTGLTPTGQRILHNLQEVYANTGRGPQDVMEQVGRDPAFGDELVQQDMFGQSVTPKFNASAPKPPPQSVPAARDATAVAKGPLAQAAAEKAPTGPHGTYIPSEEKAVSMMAGLESSPDRGGRPQVSRTGAVGKFQIEPYTARAYGFDPARLGDPAYNEMVGRSIIHKLYVQYNGNMEAMSIAYNGGPKRAQQWLNAGPGTRLEAHLDPSLRGGWRFERVASARDESFMKPETQEYVARARAKMNGVEPEPPEKGATSTWQPDTHTDEEADAERAALAKSVGDIETEEGAEAEAALNKSLSAASSYEDMSTEDRVAESMRSIGEQAKEQDGFFDRIKTSEGRAQLKSATDEWVAKRVSNWVSDLDPAKRVDVVLEKAGSLDRKADLGLEDAFRNTKSSDDRAEHSLTRGKVKGDMTTGQITATDEGGTIPRVLLAIKEAGLDSDIFHARLLSERTMNRLKASVQRAKAEGKSAREGVANAPETPISPALAHENMRDPEFAKLDQAVAHWNDMRDGKLEYMRDNHMLSDKNLEALREADPTWMSWQKLADEPAHPSSSGGFGLKKHILGLKGHSDQVINAFDGLWRDTSLAFKMSDRNSARRFARDMIEANPEVAAKYGWKKEGGRNDPNEDFIDKALREAGVDPKEITEELRDAVAPIIAQRLEKNLPKNQFFIYDEGKPSKYSVNSPELASLFRGADSAQEASTIVKSMAAVAKFERGLQIANPEFASRVLGVMHPFQTFIFDKSVPHHLPLEELFKGWSDAMGHSDLYQQAKVHGAFADWADQIDKRWADAKLSASNLEAGQRMSEPGTKEWHFQAGGVEGKGNIQIGQAMDGKRNMARSPAEFAQMLWDSYKSPMQWPQAGRDLMSKMSEINRMGAYKMALEQGMPPAKAAAVARKMFLDFQEQATSHFAQQTNSIVNYQKAHILGQKQVWEAFSNGGDARDTLVKMMVGIMGPSAGLQALSMAQDQMLPENERYTNIDQSKKDTMFISPQLPWGGRIFLPYPWGVTPVMMMQQRLLEGAFSGIFGDKGSKAKWGDTTFWLDFARSLVPPVIPRAIAPLADVATNRIWSSGQPLNSDAVMARLPADRYTYNTSLIGRALGKFLAPVTGGTFTPINVEHLITGYAGPSGMAALKAVDGVWHGATNTGRPLDMGDIPVINWMVHTAPAFSGQHIDDFYSGYADFQQQKASFSFLRKTAKGGSEVDTSGIDPEQVQANATLTRIAAGLSSDRSIAYGVENNAKMPTSEKSMALKALYAHAVVMATYGVTFMDVVRDRSKTPEQKDQILDQVRAQAQPRLDELARQFPHAG